MKHLSPVPNQHTGSRNQSTKSHKPLVDAMFQYAAKNLGPLGGSTMTFSNHLTLYVNGVKHVVNNPNPRTLLVDYLREELRLTGTKIACSEGGCGACTVTMACYEVENPKEDRENKESKEAEGKVCYYPINACLRPLCSLDGCSIITVEGVGSTAKDNMNPIQEEVSKCNGTQCGFCTPGWVTNMYGFLMEHNGEVTEAQIEKHFDGNLCRCTGYRPILDAMKSFATSNPSNMDAKDNINKDGHVYTLGYNDKKNSTSKCSSLTSSSSSLSSSPSLSSCAISSSKEADEKKSEREQIEKEVTMCKHDVKKVCSGLCHHSENNYNGNDDGWVKAESHLPRNICGQTASITDIEDVLMTQSKGVCDKNAEKAKSFVEQDSNNFPLELMTYERKRLHFTFEEVNEKNDDIDKVEWFKVYTVNEILHLLKSYQNENVQLLVGNTSLGVSKYYNNTQPKNVPDRYNIIIDIVDVDEFGITEFNPEEKEVKIGAAVTINKVIESLEKYRGENPSYLPYVQSLISVVTKHLKRVAHEQVRNVGSWAGNLMLFKRHDNFPSDVNLLWSTCDVRLNIVETNSGKRRSISMSEFWQMDLFSDDTNTKLAFFIVSMTIKIPKEPPSEESLQIGDTLIVARSFRIAQRFSNSHAHCHAAYCLNVQWNGKDSPVTCQSARITYGAVSRTTFRATKCEATLKDAVMDETTLTACLAALEEDLNEAGPTEAYGDQEYRRILARNYLYGVFLAVQPTLPPALASVADPFLNHRPISEGSQSFTTDPEEAPVSYPIKKLGGDIQTTGEARYTDDEPFPKHGFHGAFVYSDRALAKFNSIDFSTAKSIPGVVDIVVATDIPGVNCISPTEDEKLLLEVGDVVECCGAPLAIVIAVTQEIALNAARVVQVTYKEVTNESGEPVKPIILLEDAIAQQSYLPGVHDPGLPGFDVGDVDTALQNATHTLSGRISTGGQRHFYFEPQSSVAIPQEENGTVKVLVSTQAPSDTHTIVANGLGVSKHNVDIVVNRVGGGFGGKLGRSNFNALGAAVAALKLKQAVKIVNDRTTDFNMIGGREALITDYSVGFDDSGKIDALDYKMYMEGGPAIENTFGDLDMAMLWSDNLYFLPNYRLTPFACKTNTAVTTSTRAPGVIQSVQCIEEVLERIAKTLNKSVTEVQEANFYKNGECTPYGQTIDDIDTFSNVWSVLKEKANFQQKKDDCDKFNTENRWIKRGVAITGVKYGIAHAGVKASASVKIFQEDGTVLINHSGCEIGQGISTKVAQACAYKLNIPLNLIKVRPTATDKIPNATGTGGSATSETTVQAMLNGCDELLEKLEPYVYDDGKKREWADLVATASADGVMLAVEGWYSPLPGDDVFKYYVYCAAVTEVQLHVLTGEVAVLYSELQYDCGQSLNPAIDLGQIEGGFVQGLGYYLTEEVIYDINNGQLVSSGTWDYKPPSAYDIPLTFVVNFVPNDSNPKGVLRSKATGEPPMIVSNAVYFAVKEAIYAARKDASNEEYFNLLVPACNDVRLKACLVDPSQFKLK